MIRSRACILLSPLPCLLLAVSAISAQTPRANDAGWAKECSSLLRGGAPAAGPPGILPERLEEMARGQSHADQHFVACSLFMWAAAGESSAGNATLSDTDKSMAKVEQKLGAGEKLGFVDKMNHTAEALQQAEKPGPPPTQSEIDAVKSVLPQPTHPQNAQAAPQRAASAQPAATSASSTAAPASAPAATSPAAGSNEAAQSTGDQGESRAAGVSDWSQIDGYYVCYYFGYTGGSHYAGDSRTRISAFSTRASG